MTTSSLQRLFDRKGTKVKSQLEDYTTEALALAITADPRPMLRALAAVDWQGREPLALKGYDRIEAESQVRIPTSGTARRLDLKLRIGGPRRDPITVWGEVKVKAPVSGDQLEVYQATSVLPEHDARLIAISRTPLVFGDGGPVPWLPWQAVVDAIRATEEPDRWWHDLDDLLCHNDMAGAPQKEELPENAPVLDGVNAAVVRTWPGVGHLEWGKRQIKTMHKGAAKGWADRGRYETTAGPMTYGGDATHWFLQIRTTANHGRVELFPDDLIATADAGKLPPAWRRDRENTRAVLEVRLLRSQTRSAAAAVAWFGDRLGELRKAGVLDDYIARARPRK